MFTIKSRYLKSKVRHYKVPSNTVEDYFKGPKLEKYDEAMIEAMIINEDVLKWLESQQGYLKK